MRKKKIKYTVGEIRRVRTTHDFLPRPSDLRVSDEDLAEIGRRRADPNRKLVSHEEARARIKRLGA